MSPERKTVVNGVEITEHYWAGRYVVYVDSALFNGTYEQAIARAEPSPNPESVILSEEMRHE